MMLLGGSFRKWLPARLHGFPYHSSQTRLRVATPKSPKNVAKFPAKETEFCTRRDQQNSKALPFHADGTTLARYDPSPQPFHANATMSPNFKGLPISKF